MPSLIFHLLPLPPGLTGLRGACPKPAHAKPPNQGRSPLDTQFPVLLTFFVPYFSRNSKPELEDRAKWRKEAEREKEEDGRLGRSSPISPSPKLIVAQTSGLQMTAQVQKPPARHSPFAHRPRLGLCLFVVGCAFSSTDNSEWCPGPGLVAVVGVQWSRKQPRKQSLSCSQSAIGPASGGPLCSLGQPPGTAVDRCWWHAQSPGDQGGCGWDSG